MQVKFDTVARMRMTHEDFGINLFLEQGPSNMMGREFGHNAVGAFEYPKEEDRKIFIRGRFVDGYTGRKLSWLNTGRGVTKETLVEITNLTGSQKTLGTLSKEHRGQGSKISGCKYNPLGLLYISRRDGVVSRAAIGYCAETKQWGRAQREDDEGYQEESWHQPLTAAEEKYYRHTGVKNGEDFFEVIMLGKESSDDTFSNPYGLPGKHGDDTVLMELQNRFFRLPTIPYRTTKTTMFYNPDAVGVRDYGLVGQPVVLPEQTLAEGKYDRECVPLPAACGYQGVVAEFIYGKTFAARKAFPGRCAILFEDEQYDVRMRDKWANLSLGFGLSGNSTKISVILHFPNDLVHGDLYRQNLSDKVTNQTITCDQFTSFVHAARPKWVQALLNRTTMHPPKNYRGKLDSYVESLLARKAAAKEQAALEAEIRRRQSGGGTPNSGDSTRKTSSGTNSTEVVKVVADGVAGTIRPRLHAPETVWLEHGNKIPDLRGRTVKYEMAAGIGGTLYVNPDSPILEQYTDIILLGEEWHRDKLLPYVRSKVMSYVALKVAKTIVYQRFIKGTSGWTEDDVRDSLSIASLNAVVASLDDDIRTWFGAEIRGRTRYGAIRDGIGADEDGPQIDGEPMLAEAA